MYIATLENSLPLVSPKFENSKQTALIGSILASTASSNISILQMAVELLVQEKRLIEHLSEYGVTASNDEVRIFKISAAAASTNKDKSRNLKQNSVLIQGFSDNSDANL